MNLEGGRAVEQEDLFEGASPPTGDGIVDGLYTYTEGERREGAEQIYSSTFNRVREKQDSVLGPLAPGLDLAMQQARRIASQFTNCFGSDQCGVEGAFSTDFENPGTGVAVSPDDFRFWDGPATGGSFGDEEVVQYRSADYRRVHRWAVTAGTGTVAGSVALGTDGSPVQGAQVSVAGLDTGSDGFGQFSFQGVPEGRYEVRAEKLVLRGNPFQDCPADGSQLCDRLVDVKPISVAGDGSATNVDLVLEPEAAIPPPTLQVYSRRVEFSGTIIVTDQDTTSGNDIRDFDVAGSFCEVSPLNREVRVKVPEGRTCADEVRGEVYATCELQEDNETVNVTIDVDLFEGSGCGTEDHDGHDYDGPFAVPACVGDCTPEHSALLVRNTSEDGGDIVESYLSIKNQQGTLIENLPNVRPENLRRVTFSGEVEIVDDDTVDSDERGVFVFSQECLVDPFDREASFSYDRCVDDEVRLEIAVECSLSEFDNESVNVNFEARLFEGTTCLTDDRDGIQKRGILANPICTNGECGPTALQFRIANDDEGGDKAEIDVQIINGQR
ncbi:MAG: hypothetical protein RL685_1135 [Pseudomonadota bacterium]